MTTTEVALVMASTATLITSLTSAILSLRNGFNIQKIEKATNSMKDALVKATGDAAYLQGTADANKAKAL
jgi:hypothetical protein